MRAFNHRLNLQVNRELVVSRYQPVQYADMVTREMSIIGGRIRERLNDLGKNQGDLAEALDLSDNAVSKWIKTGKISRSNAVRAAEFLRTTVDYLTGKEDRLPAKAIHVALDWNTLDEPLRAQIADVIQREAQVVRERQRPAAAQAPSRSVEQGKRPPLLSRVPKRQKVEQ